MVKFYIPYKINEAIKLIHEDHKHMEWSCMCKVIDRKDGYALVDMYLPNQDNQGAFTEITEKGLEEFMTRCLENDIEDYDKRNLWMHSHNTMGLFWSGRDQEQKKEYACGGKKHFFHIVTGHGGGTGQTATLDGVRYKGCVSFYDINYEVEMEFELGLGLPEEILEIEADIENRRLEEKKPLLERKAGITEEVEKGMEAYRKQQTKHYTEAVTTAQEYVNKIVKKEHEVKFKSIELLVEDKVTAEKNKRLVAAREEIDDLIADVEGKYNEEWNEKVFPFYENLFGEQEDFINVNPEEKLTQLKENEVKKNLLSGWGKGYKGKKDWHSQTEKDWYDQTDDTYDYLDKHKSSDTGNVSIYGTPRDRTQDAGGAWIAPKNRTIKNWEYSFFRKGEYYDSMSKERKEDAFYFM